jgi:hypothetical protein
MSVRDDYPELGRIANGFGVETLEDVEAQAAAALDEIARLRQSIAASTSSTTEPQP